LNCRTGGVWLAVIVVLTGALAAQEEKSERLDAEGGRLSVDDVRDLAPYQLEAKDKPLSYVIETFMSLASAVYGEPGDHDAEFYRGFCSEHGIDSTWRSADRLGTIFREIHNEFGQRVGEAWKSPDFKDHSGQDPNDWRTEALGRAFGEIYEELRADGLPYTFEQFVAVIDRLHRVGSSYSSEPFGKGRLERREEKFWRAAEQTSSEAGRFYGEMEQ